MLLIDRLAVRRLQEECIPLSDTWPEGVRDQVTEAVQDVINALEGNGDRAKAQEKAEKAESAALERAAKTAARATAKSGPASVAASATWAADSTASALVDSPAWSEDWKAERYDAIQREAERFISELGRLPSH